MGQQSKQEEKKDSTGNIHRRYRHLFTLPARNRTLAYASVVVLLTALFARLGLGYNIAQIALILIAAEFLLLLTIEIDRQILKRTNKVATYRRLTSLTIASNSFWLVLTLVGLLAQFVSHDPTRLISLIILGALFATSFRALILGSLFFSKPWQGIPLSFVQPLVMFLPIGLKVEMLSPSSYMKNIEPISAIIGGLIALLGIEIYMSSINKIKISIFRPLELLRAFLNAWAAEDATNLERFLEATSKPITIVSRLLGISSALGSKAIIVLPGVHPGPFYPIGSSNIPADIFTRLKSSKTYPMIVHSMSHHGLNLPSKGQVERYVSTLKNQSEVIDSGSNMSLPVVKQVGKATVVGIAFGKTVSISITQAPYGMEDFPVEVREEIENYSYQHNFKNVLVIDTHNSEGEKPNESECQDALAAAREVTDILTNAKQFPFKVGIAHSSELASFFEPDIGPAGIGLILFEIATEGDLKSKEKFSLIIVDSNNSAIGFREQVFKEFEIKASSRILELCTSDTHVTAAKTSAAKGYLALGDTISVEKFTATLLDIYDMAQSDLGEGQFSSSISHSDVKTIGSEVLDDFSGLLDSASSEAKYGARILGTLVLLITIIVAII